MLCGGIARYCCQEVNILKIQKKADGSVKNCKKIFFF